jgi:hypothetical protein
VVGRVSTQQVLQTNFGQAVETGSVRSLLRVGARAFELHYRAPRREWE